MLQQSVRVLTLTCLILVALAAQTALAQSADVSVAKTADPEPVSAGATLTYTITVSSEGPDNAANVAFSDPLPPGVTFQSISPVPGWSCTTPAIGVNGTVSCSTATFSPGSVAFTLATTVDPSISNGTVLVNVATVSSTTADPHLNNNSSESDSTVAAPPGAAVSVTKAGAPDPIVAGTPLTYTITAINSGSVDLDTAAIRDTLPSSTTFVSLTPPAGWSCTAPAAGATGTVNCSTIAMPASSTAPFTLVVNVSPALPAGNLTNQAFLDYSIGGRDATVSTSVTTQVTASADLSTGITDAPDPVTPGNNIVYTITVTNAGPSNAPSATLSDPLPAGTTFVSNTAPAGWSCTAPAIGASGTLSCSNASFALGSAVFTLTVKSGPTTPAGTIITNTATASTSADSSPGNNSGTTTTTVAKASTSIVINPPFGTPAANFPFNVTFALSVTPPTQTTPTGTVTITDGSASCIATLPATGCAITFLSTGSHTLTATYSGDNNLLTSTSPPVTVNVIPLSQIPVLSHEALAALALLFAAFAVVLLGRSAS